MVLVLLVVVLRGESSPGRGMIRLVQLCLMHTGKGTRVLSDSTHVMQRKKPKKGKGAGAPDIPIDLNR